jgi:hypothetical protein
MEIRMGCKELSDQELVNALESCELPNESFHHADHIRVAWILLKEKPEAAAAQQMVSALKRFAAHNGRPERYHHTRTLAWMKLVAVARQATPKIYVFEEFLRAHPHLASQQTLLLHYSQRYLECPAARADWVEPDIAPLPNQSLSSFH